MSKMIIDLIRHGEPMGGRLYRGYNIDDPLSDKGWRQMREAVARPAPWQQIISSPLQRCSAFAQELAEQLAIPLEIDERLKEVGFGDWEGQTPQQLQQTRLDEYQTFYRDPVNRRPPGAEPLDQFIQRVTTAYRQITEQHAGKHCLVVGHAGVIRALVAHALYALPSGMYRIKVGNAGISRLQHDELGSTLIFHNTTL